MVEDREPTQLAMDAGVTSVKGPVSKSSFMEVWSIKSCSPLASMMPFRV